jgi:hypothetical protein
VALISIAIQSFRFFSEKPASTQIHPRLSARIRLSECKQHRQLLWIAAQPDAFCAFFMHDSTLLRVMTSNQPHFLGIKAEIVRLIAAHFI